MSGKGIEKELIHDLFSGKVNYNERSAELPVIHQDEPINVTISMQLNAIVDVVRDKLCR